MGDLVPVLLGPGLARVRWIGQRRVQCRRHPKPGEVMPVRIQEGAFGPGMPHRALFLSPDHAVHVDGVLIPVRYLVNGSSIAQIERAEARYWHVELEAHNVLLAEGLPAESYLDTGNRGAFGGEVPQLIRISPCACGRRPAAPDWNGWPDPGGGAPAFAGAGRRSRPCADR